MREIFLPHMESVGILMRWLGGAKNQDPHRAAIALAMSVGVMFSMIAYRPEKVTSCHWLSFRKL